MLFVFILFFFTYYLFFKFFYWIEKAKYFNFLLNTKINFLKQPKHNLNMTLVLLILNIK